MLEYPEHLNYFTRHTLDRLLAGCSLSKLEMRTTGIRPGEISAGLKRLRDGPSSTGGSGDIDAKVRARMARSQMLERSVRVANAALSRSGLGDTIKALYWLPASTQHTS